MKWYVIKVITGKEKKMKDTIESELKSNGLIKYVSRLLVPSQKTVQIRNGKKYNIEKNLYPGYILIECESMKEIEANIKHINGVSSILKQSLTQVEVDRMIGREEKKESNDVFYIGQQVKITDGAFSSFVANIKEVDENKEKVKVAVMIFGREVLMDLQFQQIANA